MFVQNEWDLDQVYEAIGDDYLQLHSATPTPPVTSPVAGRFKPMPESLYNDSSYRRKYDDAVDEVVKGLSPGVQATSFISMFL